MVFKQFLPQQRQRTDYRVISVLVTASCKVKLLDPDISLYTASDIDKADRLLFRAASRSCDTGHTESCVRSGSLRQMCIRDSLLTTDLPIVDIAVNVGFNCSRSFTRTFKKIYEMAPSEYRETHRGGKK